MEAAAIMYAPTTLNAGCGIGREGGYEGIAVSDDRG